MENLLADGNLVALVGYILRDAELIAYTSDVEGCWVVVDALISGETEGLLEKAWDFFYRLIIGSTKEEALYS